MEALDYFKEAKRMCESYPDCNGCQLINSTCEFIRCLGGCSDEGMRCAIKVVEQWSKEHPIITNARKFEEVFGLPANCMIDKDAQWLDEPYKEPEHED